MGAYIKNEEFQALVDLLEWTKRTPLIEFNALEEAEKNILVNAEVALIKVIRKRRQERARTWEYIKERRKTDPTYGRVKKIEIK